MTIQDSIYVKGLSQFLLLSLCWQLLPNPCLAQYTPLVAANKHWIYTDYHDQDTGQVEGAHLITIEGDTILDNTEYSLVFRKNLSGKNPCPPQERPCFSVDVPYATISSEVVGFIREDTLLRKVFFLPDVSDYCEEDEYLLFDFDLLVGDTLNACAGSAIGADEDETFGIIENEAMNFLFDRDRRVLTTNGLITYIGLPFADKVNLIEGVGFQTHGLFHRYNNLSELLDYCEGSLEDCNIVSSAAEESRTMSFMLYPNPVRDVLYFQTSEEFDSASLNIIDIYGQTVRRNIKGQMIDVSDLGMGIYFLKIRDDSNNLYFKKFYKQKF